MIDSLIQLDQSLFLWLNGLHSSWLDPFMWAISSKTLWIPLYAYMLFLIIRRYQWQSWIILLLVALLIVLSDQGSVLIKNSVMRFRPTHEPAIKQLVHILHNYRGGSYGFVSSHATNSFALATFTAFLIRPIYRSYPLWILLWASIVSYSRIYLGVHYPGDILGGALLGIGLGMAMWKLCTIADRKLYKNDALV